MAQFDRDAADTIAISESLEIVGPSVSIGQLTPASGPSFGGTLVTILGYGFRLPTPPAATGPTIAPDYPSVEVLFGDVPAERVDVVSTTELWVRTPLVTPGVVAVTVRNLNDSTGVPISGQSAVRANAWTSARVAVSEASESDIVRVTKRFVTMLRDGTIEEVVTGQHVDYAEDGTPHVVALAKLPALAIIGPSLPENRMYTLLDAVEIETNGEMVIRPPPFVVDLSFTMVGAAETLAQLVRLEALVIRFFERVKEVDIDRDPSNLALGKIGFEMELISRDPGTADRSRPNASSVGRFAMEVMIRGVPIEGTPGYSDNTTDNVHERTGIVDEDGYRLGGPDNLDENAAWGPETGIEQLGE